MLDWLSELAKTNTRAADACFARVRLLALLGHELRRPHADILRDGVYELRARVGRVNYRLLYFFHGRDIAMVAHALTKEAKVPSKEIDKAIERKKRYEQDPETHRLTIDL